MMRKRYALPTLCGGFLLFMALHLVVPVGGMHLLGCALHEGEPDLPGVIIWVDRSTGCHYLYTAGGPLSPRLTEDGDHFCTDRYGNYKKKTGVLGVTPKAGEREMTGEDE